MSFLAPYTSMMRVGQGFNSYTQQICVDDAVVIHEWPWVAAAPKHHLPGQFPAETGNSREKNGDDLATEMSAQEAPDSLQQPTPLKPEKFKASNVNQTVTYTAHAIDNLADVVDTLNISSSATINAGSAQTSGSASFVKENNISESDINFIVSVKVTNELPAHSTRLEFRPMEGLDPDRFSEVYGDCFIAGFLEGGEFSSIVSIKVNDKNKISKVKLAAEMELSATKYFKPATGAEGGVDSQDVWTDTEMSISVTWSGGGNIKKPKASWDLQTIIQAASDFPAQVSKYSQKTSAILMSYNSIRSFHEFNAKSTLPLVVLDYRLCDLYTAELLSAFIAYKAVWKAISKMIKVPERYKAKDASDEVPDPIQCDPISLNQAKLECRKGMTLILEETKILARKPHLGMTGEDGTVRQLPCAYASELATRLPIPLETPEISDLRRVSSLADEMTMVNQLVTNPTFLPRIDNPGGKIPRVAGTLYSTHAGGSSDRISSNHPIRTLESAGENGQLEPSRSCILSPVFLATAGSRCVDMIYRALLLKCCFRRPKKVKFRTPRGSSNPQDPMSVDQAVVMSGAIMSSTALPTEVI
ncbi:hypothetical protein FQN53_001142 [Emmonsiellopsis sp. PD_33]|nr:hypothetical protein FQN53_001142 [Emmonsiellopsis sp. PD_33]